MPGLLSRWTGLPWRARWAAENKVNMQPPSPNIKARANIRPDAAGFQAVGDLNQDLNGVHLAPLANDAPVCCDGACSGINAADGHAVDVVAGLYRPGGSSVGYPGHARVNGMYPPALYAATALDFQFLFVQLLYGASMSI
ncbi:hypothetical protein [Erwinia tracheiphila]|uniref:hypothetical protein n=1 Tax=Erwinia tracheiphila TaxID=65700 RepID=UPI001FD770CB|nr:hypothetical protein [Erwinia tracheiphila]